MERNGKKREETRRNEEKEEEEKTIRPRKKREEMPINMNKGRNGKKTTGKNGQKP